MVSLSVALSAALSPFLSPVGYSGFGVLANIGSSL